MSFKMSYKSVILSCFKCLMSECWVLRKNWGFARFAGFAAVLRKNRIRPTKFKKVKNYVPKFKKVKNYVPKFKKVKN